MEINAKPEKQHEWLKQLIGDWEMLGAATGPDEKENTCQGAESVRAIGDLWVVGEGTGEAPDGSPAFMSVLTLGYDPAKGAFVGTWIGSMMTHMWVYQGELDSTGKVLTLNTEGPDMEHPGTTARYRDIIELTDDGKRLLISEMLGADGEWKRFMNVTYTRKR